MSARTGLDGVVMTQSIEITHADGAIYETAGNELFSIALPANAYFISLLAKADGTLESGADLTVQFGFEPGTGGEIAGANAVFRAGTRVYVDVGTVFTGAQFASVPGNEDNELFVKGTVVTPAGAAAGTDGRTIRVYVTYTTFGG